MRKRLQGYGIAGGLKYKVDGIFIKLAVSTFGGLFETDEAAMKNAASELRALNEFIACEVEGVHFELLATCDYKGFRTLCFSELPIQPDQTIGACVPSYDPNMLQYTAVKMGVNPFINRLKWKVR